MNPFAQILCWTVGKIERPRISGLLLPLVAVVAFMSAAAFAAQGSWTGSDIDGLQEAVLKINGEDYLVRDSRTDGPAVLLVHGMPDDGLIWRKQVPELLKAGYRIIVPDTLGVGRSAKSADLTRFKSDRMVADLASILDQLGISKVHYIGHDVGAVLGWEFAMTYPQRVISYVTITVGHPSAWAKESFTLFGARMNWYSMLNSTPNSGEVWRAGNGRLLRMALESHPDRARVFEYMMKPGGTEYAWMFDTVNSITSFMIAYANGAYDNLPRITCPTLGIIGNKDVAMWLSQMSYSKAYIDAEWRMEVLEAGHWLPLEKPAETNAILLDWLQAHR